VRKFELYNPIRMIFGAGAFDQLGELAAEYGSKPLVVVGRSHARESGLLDRALELLTGAGLDPVVFEGVEPNPRVTTCEKAALLARENGCDLVIGIGGGSVMDASKAIAFGFYDPEGIWKRIAHWNEDHEKIDKALPVILASTLAATGSEGDSGSVISNDETREKAGVIDDALFPRVSIIDPELTLSVPLDYTRDGAIDMILHVLESYFNGEEDAPFADRCTEGFVAEAVTALETVLEDPEDIDARSQLSYLGAIALHGFINKPRGGVFQIHMLQHPLSAHYDISHGRGLALLLPRWLRYVSRDNPDKIIQFGDRVFGMALENYHPFEAVDRVIDRLDEWLESVGAWFYMEDFGIPNDPAKLQEVAESAIRVYGAKEGVIDGIKPLALDDIVAIYRNCVRIGTPEAVMEEEPEEPIEDIVEEDAQREEVMEEVIIVEEGEALPEGVEGEYVVEEVIVEEEEPKQEQ